MREHNFVAFFNSVDGRIRKLFYVIDVFVFPYDDEQSEKNRKRKKKTIMNVTN